jgi:hypothetical protein
MMGEPEEIMRQVGEVLLCNNAALFMTGLCSLWIGGVEVGLVVNDDGGCGHEFIIHRGHTRQEKQPPIDIEWYKVTGAPRASMISIHAMLIYEDGTREIACGYSNPMVEAQPPTGSTICGRCHVKLCNNEFYGIIRQCEACGYIGKPLVRRPDSDYEQFCPECGAVNSFPVPDKPPDKSRVTTPLFLASMPIPNKQGRTPWLPKK